MTEPAVIPAVPVDPAAPAAPVADPSLVPSPELQAAAVAPDPVPVAAPAVAAPAVAPASLVPEPAPVAPVDDAKWYLSEGVPGTGEAPDWFKGDKYKTMEEQAKAYPELEGRFGAFAGSPEDGVYTINVPEDVPVQFDTSHALFQELNKWAGESQLSQKGYDNLINMFSRYEASMFPDMNEIKKGVGENADARLSSVAQWAKSNLTPELYDAFRNAQTQSNAADAFKVIEAIIGKTRDVPMPKPGDDVPGATATGLEEIDKMQAALVAEGEDKGKRRYEVDSEYRAEVERKRFAWFASQSQ